MTTWERKKQADREKGAMNCRTMTGSVIHIQDRSQTDYYGRSSHTLCGKRADLNWQLGIPHWGGGCHRCGRCKKIYLNRIGL